MISNINQSETLRRAAAALVTSDSDAAAIQSVATVMKYAAEADKAVLETHNMSRSATNDAFRFYIPVIAPLVSALAVVAALVFQTVQFRESSRLQAQTVELQKKTFEIQAKSAEDSAWREALKTLTQSPTVMSGLTGSTLLSTYLMSGSHVEEARVIAVSLLGDLAFLNIFKPLFESTINATPPERRLRVIADISYQLRLSYIRLNSASNELRPPPNPDRPVLIDRMGKEYSNPLFARDQVNDQLTLVCETVADILKVSKLTLKSTETTGFTIWSCDMSNIIFSKLGLTAADIRYVTLGDADLSTITDYANSVWSNTAWWHVKKIDRGLLQYLTAKYPFSEKVVYNSSETRKAYNADVTRLATVL